MYSASVIIPVYNAEKTLRKCVESLHYGDERNIEIILIDDCSRDNSWDLCNTLSKEFPNVRCYQNEKNSGVSFTRNHGLEVATAPYVLFVDSDDWVSSRYASKLLASAEAYPDSLVLCGLRFLENMSGYQQTYLWDDSDRSTVIVPQSQFFNLVTKVLIQSPCNKVFHRSIIEKYALRFDTLQNMGEDFQFVLDYLEAAKIQKCVVLNESLYYYIRWNNSSLMSEFGFIDNQHEIERMEQLARIVGSDAESDKEAMIEQSKRNCVYHIVRNTNHSKAEKLKAIERIMADGKAKAYYQEQRKQLSKERIKNHFQKVKLLIPRIKGRLQRSLVQKTIRKAVKGLNAAGITIISQNCIGGVFYHDMGLQFLSPTINAFIPEPGFVKMVLNLRHYMEQDLVMRWGEEYPIGTLDDVEIHFMHYDTCKEAKEAWDRRKARINWNKIFVIGTDRDGFDEKTYEQWKQIDYPKILFTAHPEFTEDAQLLSEFTKEGQVGDLISQRKFYRHHCLIKAMDCFGK